MGTRFDAEPVTPDTPSLRDVSLGEIQAAADLIAFVDNTVQVPE